MSNLAFLEEEMEAASGTFPWSSLQLASSNLLNLWGIARETERSRTAQMDGHDAECLRPAGEMLERRQERRKGREGMPLTR